MTVMTSWIARLTWKLRGMRNVRLQLLSGDAVDGILVGMIKGHYRIAQAQFYSKATPEVAEDMLGETWILKERVFLLNVKTFS